MEWNDEAIVLAAQKHEDKGLIVQLLTCEHGLHAGMVRGVRKQLPICQQGNVVQACWRGRLAEQLGSYTLELVNPVAAKAMQSRVRLTMISALTALLTRTMQERDPHPEIYVMVHDFLIGLESDLMALVAYCHLERALLSYLGFGLNLTECAATGAKENLIYVSPKTGRAVCAEAGEPYKAKLLRVPDFWPMPEAAGDIFDINKLVSQNTPVENPALLADILCSLNVTRYFLEHHVLEVIGRRLPNIRYQLEDRVAGMIETR